MENWNFSLFYRTSFPIGAAALLHIHVNYRILKQGKGTADHMISLDYWFLSFYFFNSRESRPFWARATSEGIAQAQKGLPKPRRGRLSPEGVARAQKGSTMG